VDKEIRPFGLWPSALTADLLGLRVNLDDVQWDANGHSHTAEIALVWSEGRSNRKVIVGEAPGGAPRDLTDEFNPGGGVGYGGGDFAVSNGRLVFAERDGRLYRRELAHGRPRPITPPFGQAASPAISPDGKWVLYVHTFNRQDALGLVDAEGQCWPVKLVQGADFYMQPTWHPDGQRLAWIEWNHPNMPWDGTRLVVGRLDPNGPQLASRQEMAGGPDTPIFQPGFSPDGRWLSYIAGEGEWEHLVIVDLASGERRVLVQNANLSTPAWIQGMRTYGWSPTSRRIFYLRNDEGIASLWQVDLEGGVSTRLEVGPYSWLSQLAVASDEETLAMVASSATIPTRLITWKNGQVEIVRYSESESLDPADLPQAVPISWTALDGARVYGLYYAPTNRRFTGSGLPPAIINIHGGPTSQAIASYSADTAFFTNRGYAVLNVNYRGSTGYGRTYMLALRQHWGDLDVEDAAGGAQALVDQGLANPRQLVIRGGSAGGYTVLNALIRFPGRFKAGLCSFGVSNLFTLNLETHKFEEHYNDTLVGVLPDAAERFQAWSPVFHADRIQDPIAVFQGSEDKVVPPDQSESIVRVLQARRVPHIYRLYEGEGHGFRKTETILAYYKDIERFLQQYVLFSA
jgi:dipeptidyl aminopeptidase/acylaminoacyl peptidase